MGTFNRRGRAWRLLSLAVIAVPWFLRDQLASTLDRHTQTAQHIMDALHHEKQRQLRDHEQRDTSQRLQRIEIDVLRLAKSSTDQEADEAMAAARVQELHDEAGALASGVEAFQNLLPEVSLTADQRGRMEAAARAAQASADQLVRDVQVGSDEHLVRALLKQFDHDGDALEKAFEELHGAADRQRATSAGWANTSRFVAWVLTALGALMIGNWRKALNQSEGGDA